MKYVRFRQEGKETYGIWEEGAVELISGSPYQGATERTGAKVSIDSITDFLPPIDNIPNVLCIGLNYADHAKEANMEVPKAPVLFLKTTTAVTAHKKPIILPKVAPHEVDYEAELVVIIGKTARHVPKEKVSEYIFGYTCGHDISARDLQLREDVQWSRGKSFDSFAPIGPFVETEYDPSDMRVQFRLNGRTMQNLTTKDMMFDVPTIVSYLSKQMTLLPGTIIMTGTPPGVGFSRKPPVFMRPGDKAEVDIEGLGVLENIVEMEK